ncbi:Crocetin glucosyltransferase chloroplastic [Bienertia sinuspersici]
MEQQKPHFLIVTFPAQGHINPALQFATRLLGAGAHVTFATAASGNRCLEKSAISDGLAFATFSDGYDNGFKATDGDISNYLSTFGQRGGRAMVELFEKSSAEGKPVTCLVYTLLLPWAAGVARELHVPSALLWIQPALVFDIYYYYFSGYQDIINDCEKDPSWSLELPNLPLKLKSHDLPSFLLPSNPNLYAFALPTFKQQVEELEKEENPKILVNTFEALEFDALKSIEKFKLIPIGPLLSSAFLNNGKDPTNKSFGGSKGADYMKWLDTQEKHSSVIYISFGSLSVLSGAQMEELARSLIQTHRPFLWVIREKESVDKDSKEGNDVDEISCMEQLKQQGLIVPWCSQVEVLSHPSVGCFVTHCGWNSTLESITSGVPMVAFPQWTDQTTNAKLVEDVWEVGVKARVSEEGGLVKSDEIKRCLEEVIESEKIRENAKKWKDLAIEAAKEGGTSDRNLKAFMEELFDVDCFK